MGMMALPGRGARPETRWGGVSLFEKRLQINGAVLDYATDDFAAIQTSLNECTPAAANGFAVCRMPPGVVGAMLSGELVFDRKKIQIDLNGTRWDWRPLTGSNKNFVSPFCSSGSDGAGVGDRAAMGGIVNGFLLKTLSDGTSASVSSVANNLTILNLDSAAEPGSGRMLFRDLHFEGAPAINAQRNAYICTFDHLTFSRTGKAIKSKNRTLGNHSNQGERMSMTSCLFGNNFEHFDIEGEFWHLVNCSLDHLSNGGDRQRIATLDSGGVLLLNQCHIEFRDTDGLDSTGAATTAKEAMIYVGANSIFDWNQGVFYVAASSSSGGALSDAADGQGQAFNNLKHFVEITGNALKVNVNPSYRNNTALFKSRKLMHMANAVTVPPSYVFAGGMDEPMGGKSIVPLLGRAAQLNAAGSAVLGTARRFGRLRNPDFDNTTLPMRDEWWICGGSGNLLTGQSDRYTATGVAMTISGNTLRTAVTGAGGSGSLRRVCLAVPIEKNATIGLEFTVAKTGGAAGNTITCEVHKAVQAPPDALYEPKYTSVGQIGSTLTLMTFAGTGSEGPLTFNINHFNATMDTGARVMQNEAGTHFLVIFFIGTVDGTTTPFEMQITSVSVAPV